VNPTLYSQFIRSGMFNNLGFVWFKEERAYVQGMAAREVPVALEHLVRELTFINIGPRARVLSVARALHVSSLGCSILLFKFGHVTCGSGKGNNGAERLETVCVRHWSATQSGSCYVHLARICCLEAVTLRRSTCWVELD
jgi:hypothetical protein